MSGFKNLTTSLRYTKHVPAEDQASFSPKEHSPSYETERKNSVRPAGVWSGDGGDFVRF